MERCVKQFVSIALSVVWLSAMAVGCCSTEEPEPQRSGVDALPPRGGVGEAVLEGERREQDSDAAKPAAMEVASVQGERLGALRAEDVLKVINGSGWVVLGAPHTTEKEGSKVVLFSIISPPKGGVVGLCDYENPQVAKSFAERMKEQPGGGVVMLEGGRVLTVAVPQHRDVAQRLLDKIVKGAGAKPKKQ